jgi:hypothetical protein
MGPSRPNRMGNVSTISCDKASLIVKAPEHYRAYLIAMKREDGKRSHFLTRETNPIVVMTVLRLFYRATYLRCPAGDRLIRWRAGPISRKLMPFID